jgi:hypothetical protein
VPLPSPVEPRNTRSQRAWPAIVRAAYPCLLLLVVLGSVALSLRAVWSFTIDDAGISYAYAKHLAEGRGPVAVVGGPRIEGYSNPLWVLLLVPVHWLGLPIPEAAKVLGALLFASALAAGLAFLLLARGRGVRSLGANEAAFAIATTLCLEIVVWVPAGLENALFSALLLGMIFLDAREAQRGDALALSGLCAFALSITRPEALLYAAPLPVIKLARALRKHEPMRQAVMASLLFIGPLLVYHGGHYLVFGELFPNTYHAKPGGREWQRGFDYLTLAARESGLIYGLPLALVGLIGSLRIRWLAGWALISGTIFVLYSGGDWMPHGRFLSLFAPASLLLGALGLQRLTDLGVRLSASRLPRELGALGLAGPALVVWGLFQAPRLQALQRRPWCHFCERVADTARLQRLSTRAGIPSSSLVTHDFGGPSWLSDESFYPLDFLGLCDRSIVLIRDKRWRGGVRYESRYYQYLIHEQPVAPSWILVPPNFWPGFDHSPEFVSDYYTLDPRLLPRARRDAFFALHRGELVDYFPPLPRFGFLPLTEQLTLGGYAAFAGSAELAGSAASSAPPASVAPGAKIHVLLSLLPRGKLGTEEVSVRVAGGGETTSSAAVRLDRGLSGLARQLKPGEPLALELALTLPNASTESYALSLVLSSAPARGTAAPVEPTVVPLGELAVGSALSTVGRVLPRYPSALPAPLDADLRALGPAVATRVDEDRRRGRAAPNDEPLSNRLAAIGERLDAEGHPDQAYLAYVWATQVNRRAWERFAETIHRLRPPATDDEPTMEVALLQRFYADGGATELARLVAFYRAGGRQREAEYFTSRWPDADAPDAPESPNPERVAAVFHGPFDDALDFESNALEPWTGDLAAFHAGPDPDGRLSRGLRGQHGTGVLSSRPDGEKSRGTIRSREFPIDGRLMSLLVGGNAAKHKVGIDLLIDNHIAFTASGNDSENLLPIFWDLTPYQGKRATLRVFDKSPRHHVQVDRILIWR